MRHVRILNLFISSILPNTSPLLKVQRKSIATCLGCGRFQQSTLLPVNRISRLSTAQASCSSIQQQQKRSQSSHFTAASQNDKIPPTTNEATTTKKYANIHVNSRPAEPSIAINKLAAQGRSVEALNIYLKLLAEGGFPSREALYQLVRGLYKSHNLAGMYAVHDTLLSHFTTNKHQQQPITSKRSARSMIYMYTMLINLICKTTRPVNMTTIFQLCKEMTWFLPAEKANIVLYNTLIKTLLEQGQHSRAQELLKDLKEKEIQPTIITFGILIKDASRRKDVTSIMKYLDEMENTRIPPDYAIVSILVTTLCDLQEFDRAKDMVEKLYKSRSGPETLVGTNFRHQLLKSIDIKRKKFNRNKPL